MFYNNNNETRMESQARNEEFLRLITALKNAGYDLELVDCGKGKEVAFNAGPLYRNDVEYGGFWRENYFTIRLTLKATDFNLEGAKNRAEYSSTLSKIDDQLNTIEHYRERLNERKKELTKKREGALNYINTLNNLLK